MSKRAKKTGAKSRRRKGVSTSYRVNARFDGEAREKLTLLELQSSMSTSDVLRDAVAMLFEHRTAAKSHRSVLSTLVGKFEGSSDLSENYKSVLTSSLLAKHNES